MPQISRTSSPLFRPRSRPATYCQSRSALVEPPHERTRAGNSIGSPSISTCETSARDASLHSRQPLQCKSARRTAESRAPLRTTGAARTRDRLRPGTIPPRSRQSHPEWNVLGLEIRDHFVESAIKRAREDELDNLHAVVAMRIFTSPSSSTMQVSPLFPLTFPTLGSKTSSKAAGYTGRISRPTRSKFVVGGELHIMTDSSRLEKRPSKC